MQKLMHPPKRLGEIKLGPQNTADLSFCQSTYRVLRTVAHYFDEAEKVSKICFKKLHLSVMPSWSSNANWLWIFVYNIGHIINQIQQVRLDLNQKLNLVYSAQWSNLPISLQAVHQILRLIISIYYSLHKEANSITVP